MVAGAGFEPALPGYEPGVITGFTTPHQGCPGEDAARRGNSPITRRNDAAKVDCEDGQRLASRGCQRPQDEERSVGLSHKTDLLAEARKLVADQHVQTYHKNAIMYGEWDAGRLVQDALAKLRSQATGEP